MKRCIAIIMSAAIAIGSTAIGMAAITFSDINNVPWEGAKLYITKVSDLGLMVGEDNGNGTNVFRAKDNVTYFETIQLAYNILKNEKLASDSDSRIIKWKPAMEGYKIPQWSYQAVSYALSEGIVSVSDLSGFIKNGKNVNSTREDVAVIFGRALSGEYSVKSNPVLSFNDSGKVSSVAAPYVNLLSELKILVGDDNKNFNPKNYINRAEMAVVTTKTYSVLSGEKIDLSLEEATGTVISVSGSGAKRTIELKLTNGEKINLTGTENTPVTYKNKNVSFLGITAGDNLTVYYTGSTITKVIVNFDFLVEEESSVSGTINFMTSEKITINKSGGGSAVYNLSPMASIKLNNEEVSVSRITRVIDNGVTVNVTVRISGGVVTAVTAQGLENTVQGVITKVNYDDITIKRNAGTAKTYYFSYDLSVKYEGETARVKDIINAVSEGVEVNVTATLDDNNEIERIVASISKDGGVYSGSVKKLTEERITIVNSDGESSYYSIDENTVVTFEDSSISLYKLVSKFEDGTALSAKIYLNSSRKVSKIVAKLDDNSTGTITSINQNYITIKTDGGLERKLLMDEDVVVKFNENETAKLSTLLDVFEPGKTGVTLTFNSKDVVVKIVADIDSGSYDIVTGDITNIGSDSMKIASKTIYLSSSTTVVINEKESTVAELRKGFQSGEKFSARVSFSDNMARNITAELDEAEGRIYSMVKGQITLNTSGGLRSYNLADNDDLIIRIDGSKTNYEFSELYSLWFVSKNNYDVVLTFDGGKVIRILATSV